MRRSASFRGERAARLSGSGEKIARREEEEEEEEEGEGARYAGPKGERGTRLQGSNTG